MNVKDFFSVLEKNPNLLMHWMLPDKSFVPAHYHITEIGRVKKDFVDCGGTIRSLTTCLMQIWVANDIDHRLDTNKLASIFGFAKQLIDSDDVPLEVEYEDNKVSQYPIAGIEMTPSGLLIYLGSKHTSCLAPDKCGVSGCC